MCEDCDFFKSGYSGKKLSEIAQARVERFKFEGRAPEEIIQAELTHQGAVEAERLLKENKPGEANVYMISSIIAGIMSEIPPPILMLHFTKIVKDALFLRRIHDPHFDEALAKAEMNTELLLSEDDGHIH